jgi:hypothetical protein
MAKVDLRKEKLTLVELQRLVANLCDYLEVDVERPDPQAAKFPLRIVYKGPGERRHD